MPDSRTDSLVQLAQDTARRITGSHTAWMAYLQTAARLYKYPYHEQLLIFAQRPQATACAGYEVWTNTMRRYVRRGAKGIALLDTSGDAPRLRYVFDVADTGELSQSRSLNLWKLSEENAQAVSLSLENGYDVPAREGLERQLRAISSQLAGACWVDRKQEIFDIVDGSFLEGYDEGAIEASFRRAASVSLEYALRSRCGLANEGRFIREDFIPVTEWNTPEAAAALGTAVSEMSGEVLRTIEISIRNHERSLSHDYLPAERRDPDSRPEAQRNREPAPGQVRADAQDVPANASDDAVEQPAAKRDIAGAPAGDRRGGTEPSGAADAGADEGRGRDGGIESQRPDAMGRPDERLQGAGRGNHPQGAGVQLSFLEGLAAQPGTERAESDMPSALSIPQEVVDEVLRMGGNTAHHRERIVAAFEKQKPDTADFLRSLLHGGNGIVTDAGTFAAWYDETGIRISRGRSARYAPSAKLVSWQEAASRIGQLLEEGRFAANVELAGAEGYERFRLAEKLWYLRQDFSGKAIDAGYLSSLAKDMEGGFQEGTEWLAEKLTDPAFRARLNSEYRQFLSDQQQSGDLLRFHFHRPDEILEALEDLDLPRRAFSSEMAEIPPVRQFITEDEIDANLAKGGLMSGSKGRIFAFFQQFYSDRERVDFLKQEYGTGGRSHALSNADGSDESHSGKGIRYRKRECSEVHLTWEKVAGRIAGLIRQGLYLTEQEQAEYDRIQAEKVQAEKDAPQAPQPDPAVWEYNGVKERHPDDLVLYQMGDFFELYGEDAREAAPELGLQLVSRAIPAGGRVEMCGFPANRLDQYLEQLRARHDVTVSAASEGSAQRREYSVLSTGHEAEQELHEQYKSIVREAVTQDTAYRNACGHSDYENAVIEGHAAIHRAVLGAGNMGLLRAYSDMPEFRQRLQREIIGETYPKLHELLRPLSQDDIDDAIRTWNGDIQSKQAVVRYMEAHAREKDTAAWLAHEYSGRDSKSLFVIRAGSPEGIELPWPKVQRLIAQLIKEDRFLTEQDRQSEPQSQEKRPYQVVVYHHFENGFDEKKEYPTLEEAEKAAKSYVDGTMEPDGFAYDGAAVYDLEARQYLRIYGDYPDEKAHEQINELAHPHDLDAEVEAWEAEQAAQKQTVIDTLSEQEQLTVRAMETAGFIFNPQAAKPGLKENLVFTAGEYGYPITFENWEQAYLWIDGAELRDTPGLHEQVQHILHPEPQNSVLTNEDYAVVRGTFRERTSYDPAVPPYHVGDIVYLDDLAHQITGLRDDTVQLLPTGMSYPIYRAESRERFVQLLREDNRNDFYTEFLPANLDTVNQDLRDVLSHGLIGEADKAEVSELLHSGKSNREVALWLSRAYSNIVETMDLETGDTADYRTTPEGIELEVLDADEKRLAMLFFRWDEVAPLLRGLYARQLDGFGQERPEPTAETPAFHAETVAVYPGDKNHLPYDVVVQTLRTNEPELPAPAAETEKAQDEVLDEHSASVRVNGEWQTFSNARAAEEAAFGEYKENLRRNAENFHIIDDHLGEGGPKAKFQANIEAIKLLKYLEETTGQATPEQQETLSRYVGWGGIPQAFDAQNEDWRREYAELKALLSKTEYVSARASTLNAHYTSPAVIRAIYDAVEQMGFRTGNILEPAMGVGNFFGLLPESMAGSRLYGVELDSLTGRIARQLYPEADITVAGFETTDRRDFFDLAVGNVPFGNYQVNDKAYNKLGFSIHNYFFAKAIDQVRPGGVVAFVTSRYTMDAKDSTVRRYLAQRAELLGAIRLPDNAFKANAGTEVVSDIIFLQKRDRPLDIVPEWTQTGQTGNGFTMNQYFIDHPEMVLGRPTAESTQYGKQDYTVAPIEGLELADQLHDAVKYIRGTYLEAEPPELGTGEAIRAAIPADPNVKNYTYTVVDGQVYYRENSLMARPDLSAAAEARVRGMVSLRDCVRELIALQMDPATPDGAIRDQQAELNRRYDAYTAKYGLLNSRGNAQAFSDDSSYYLLCSLEILDEDGNLRRKADMFTRRTIRPAQAVDHVDSASEALALSIAEKAGVDMAYMEQLTGQTRDELASQLQGAIYRLPESAGDEPCYVTADEYLSGNIRSKLASARLAAEKDEAFQINVSALEKAMPRDLDASEIEVRLGATWIPPRYIQQFMLELLQPPIQARYRLRVAYSSATAEWQIENKSSVPAHNVAAYTTYGTGRASAYRILEDSLNLRDVRIYDTVQDADGKEKRVLNSKETTLAQQKQQAVKDAFRDWLWQDPTRRQELCARYNELFNATRPREYDGSHIRFSGMNPEITLRRHQRDAIAHILYGGNCLLAHEVGAGKTFEMVAACMESKRLGLCSKALFAVPNHLTEQWASEFLRLYPSANLLVASKKDFETKNRKKFCARIATGDYDAIIIGHSQFEKIPISQERQERLLQEQIDEIEEGVEKLRASHAERFTIKQLERMKKQLETKLQKLTSATRKDDVVTFEQLGVDRLYVDEAHNYKNLFLYTKMRNVAGLSTTDAQKSSDMYLKCRYMDELTGGRGIVFATGTPVSNSMTELYTMMRYLQHDLLASRGFSHFDCWASTFGETVTAIELAPEGTGYRARTRFARFFNLPELMAMFREAADIKTADQLHLPIPEAVYHNVVAKPTEMQKDMVEALSKRAAEVHAGVVNPKEDNMLKITSDGRKLGLDQRILNPLLPDDEHSKVNQCVENILRIWREGESGKLTQLVFSDLSTPGGEGFTVYEDIRRKLIAAGVPEGEIAFIHDANTEVKKKELFAKVRAGQVRVLLGSTQKMGAGTNVQDRLAALHDLDCPWRPGDLEQRKGRIVRQGNRNDTVHIYRYVTENTFDAYLWQTIENKQKFISQIMTSKSPVRSCEDVDETALSYAEIKALCAGNPLIKEKMDLDIEVARLRLLKANHQSQRFQMEDRLLKYFPVELEKCRAQVGGFEADLETRNNHPLPSEGFVGMEVLGHTFSDKEEAGKAILEAVKTVVDMKSVRIGHYRGFEMSLELSAFGREYILTLRGRMAHFTTLGSDPRGNIQRIDNTLGSMESRLKTVQDQIATLQKEQEAAKEEIAKPFAQEDELREKSARLIELDTLLDIGKGSPEVMPEGGEPEAMEAAVPDTAQGTREPERKERSREEVR